MVSNLTLVSLSSRSGLLKKIQNKIDYGILKKTRAELGSVTRVIDPQH
jgi:hypothetical protein